MIRFENVSKTFHEKNHKVHALKPTTFSVEKGSIHGIIGHSGAGKSTLIRLINQLEVHDNGTLEVLEYKDIRKLNKESMRMLRRKIGMIFQHFNLLENKTVLQNVLFPISAFNKPNKKDKQKALDLIKSVGLKGVEHTYPAKLSGGMKQRVGIARALINDPEILLCDEPTSALDVNTTQNILNIIKNIKESRDLTVVFVTHDMNVVKAVCDYVTVMDNGVIVEQGTLDNILFNAKHPITKSLTASIGFNIEAIASNYKESENLLLLRFKKHITHQEILSKIILTHNISINILFANITPSSEGVMLVSIESDDIHQTKKVLKEYGVEIVHDRF